MAGKKTLIVVLGPTAIGKTAYAIDIAKHFETEIISADSRQFFSELDIGVARPSTAELNSVTHHFIGFLPIDEHYSAGRFADESLTLVNRLFETHDVVVVVGGSMLYIDALIHGFDDLPSDRNIKNELQKEFEEHGIDHLQSKLRALDPEYFLQVDTMNPHRLIRAIEVCTVSGKKYSELRKNELRPRPFRVVKIGLTAQRNYLYKRINQRVDIMFSEGLLEEARELYDKRDLNALNTVGYKEVFDYLDGTLSLEEAKDKIKQHTRNFAKRQLTWWRRDETINWLDVTATKPSVGFAEHVISVS